MSIAGVLTVLCTYKVDKVRCYYYYWLGQSVAKQRVSQNNEVKGCILTYYIPSLPLIKLNKT